MTRFSENYFRYLPLSHELRQWGLGVTASGFSRIPAGAEYPPAKHPEDHHFDGEHGRVLDSLQIVLISAGRGWLETRATGKRSVEAGMVFLLLPKTWHRYRPEPQTGWEESWIEVQGPVVDGLLQAGTFLPRTILRRGAIDAGLEEMLNSIHRRSQKGEIGFPPELSAAALQVLALCARIAPTRSKPSRIERAVNEAARYLRDNHAQAVNVEALAERLGVAYSHFRRAFRAHTGFAPWQYVIHLRLTRARRLLASSDAKLDDIAARVGFSSGFHLSIAFKQAYGHSPHTWRQTLT
ncbi:MAG: AraC family transcriptional regulator [Verrucomicrobiota bacterium]